VLDANGNLTIGFSEEVKGFDAADVKVTGGTVSGLTQQPDGSWTGKVVAAGNTGALGKVTVDVADNSYTDLAGNNGKGSTASKDIPSVDTTAPSATITVGANGEVTISFSEPVKGFDAQDVQVTGGTLTGLTQQPDGSWKGQVVANGTTGSPGLVDLKIPAGSYTDNAGNPGKEATAAQSVPSLDTTAPSATIAVDAAGNVTVSFSEPVKGFDKSDLKVAGGTLQDLVEQPDGSWKGHVVANDPTGTPAKVDLSITAGSYTDTAGNLGTAASQSQTVPSIDITAPSSIITLSTNGDITISFSESVKGFDATDVKVAGGTLISLTAQPDGTWTGKVAANGNTGASSSVAVEVVANSYTDLAGNLGKGATAVQTVPSIDTAAPTSVTTLDAAGNLKITFSEAVKGFDANDVKVTGGTVSGLTQQPDGSWTGKVVAAGNTGALGKVTVDVADNSYTDLAGNNGKGSTASKDIPSVDTTAPSATITVGANGEVTISFSEPVKGFDAQDVQVTGGTLTGLTQQPDGSWKGQVVANGTTGSPGLVDLKIPAGSYTDNAGNPGKEATAAQSVPSLDTTAPSATIAVDAAGNVTVSFSEPVKGFDKSDLKVAGGTLQDLVEQPDGSWKGHVVANDPTGTPAKVDLSITAGSYTDTAGNLGTAASQSQTVPSIDITAPSSIITLSTNGDITISFSESVKGFDATDVKVAGGTLISLTAQPDGTWTGKVAANGNTGASSSVAVEVVANSYTDLAGNLGKGATAVQTVPSIDTAAPTSVTTLDAAGNLKITFSEAVKGFDANDVKVTGGTVSGLTQQPDGSWTGKVVAAGNTGALGKVTVDIADNSYTDLAGNNGKGSTASKDVPSVDSTPPEATISIAPNGDVTISFSEPVKGFDAADVKVAGGTISGLTQQPDGSWKGHAVSNDPAGAPGKVDITIDAGSYTDNAGNAGKAASGSLTVLGTDTTAPTSSMVLDKAGNLAITFTEAVKDFTLSDLVVTGGTVSALTQQTNGTWTAKVTTAGNTGGSVKVDLADSSYTDLAGNAGKGSSVQQSVDSTAPSAAITLDTQGNVIVSFSEKVTGFDPSDLKVTGAIVKDLTEQADGTWKGAVQVPTVGVNTPVNFEISAGSYEDVSGNKGLEVKLDTIVYPPTVEIDPFDFFAAAPVMKFAARTLLAAEPLPPATNNPKQTFNGSSANSVEVKINLYDSSNNIVDSGMAVLNTATGRWSYTPAKPLADGQFRLEAISKDIYGVTSAPANIKFIIDTVKPTIDIDDAGAVSDATPSFSGKTEANATVTVTVKDATGKVLASGAAAVAADGSWTYTAPNLADGTYTVEAVAKDRAGNLSAPDSTSVTVDTVTQLDALTVTANPDGTATVAGKAEAGATVTVKDPNGNNLTVTVNADGTFSAIAPAPATEGIYTAATTDAVGNTASATANLDDNVAPVIVNLDVTPNTDGTATVTGRTEIGSTVTLKDPNGKDVPVTVNPDGTFTATVPAPAAEGAYTATATDPAGNAGTATDVLDDNIAPAVTVDVVSNPDGSATITGKSEPGSTVTLKDPNGKDVPVTVNPDGTYTAIVPATAAEGTYTATAKDPAGNAGTASDSLADTTAPSMLTAQVDAKTGGFVTGVAQAGSAITVYTDDGKTVLGTGTANASGQYSVTLKPAQV
ncbi:MAG: Ig-like domain-containing protein, partial [Acinetobacter sp.]